jgi:hypothetical protein
VSLLKISKLHLDVDIGELGIELCPIPNQTSFGNRSQYQIHYLDVDEIATQNSTKWHLQNQN